MVEYSNTLTSSKTNAYRARATPASWRKTMSKNLCVNCKQPCFVNRIAVEIFDKDYNVIGNGYRCEECHEKFVKEMDKFIEECDDQRDGCGVKIIIK